MYLTGFADEAGKDVETQIKATKELGWTYIEMRSAGEANLHDIPDDEFDRVYGLLQDAGIEINCFGSAIANWQRSIEEPFDVTLEQIDRAIPRMQKMGTKMIRIMSYCLRPDCGPEEQLADERFRRVAEIKKRFDDAGLIPVHENCMNYGGMGLGYTLKLIENVPGLRLVFDTGNPVFSVDYCKPEPRPMQSAWEFYAAVREHIEYVHIKDGTWDAETECTAYSFPGEGDGDVRRIVKDLLETGYGGGFSIEPHMGSVHHEGDTGSPEAIKYANYVEYGRRMAKLVEEVSS